MVAKKRTAASSKKKASATGFISDLDCYLFGAGTQYDIYQKLGAHPKTYKGKEGIYFAVWAPHAKEVQMCIRDRKRPAIRQRICFRPIQA